MRAHMSLPTIASAVLAVLVLLAALPALAKSPLDARQHRERAEFDDASIILESLLAEPDALPPVTRLDAFNERALLHLQLGDADAARNDIDAALALLPELGLSDSPRHASLLTTLGAATRAAGNGDGMDAALALHRQALAMLDAFSGDENDTLRAEILSNIGFTLGSSGSHAESIPYLEEAVELSAGNPSARARALNNLGMALLLDGEVKRAEENFEAGFKEVLTRTADWDHRIQIMGNLVLCAHLLGEDNYLFETLAPALTLQERRYLLDRLPHSDEATMRRVVGSRGFADSLVYSALFAVNEQTEGQARAGAQAALMLKGIVLEALAERAARTQADANTETSSLEARFQEDASILQQVQDRLKPGDILLEFVRYWHLDLDTALDGNARGEARYACFVIKGGGEPITAVNLGDSAPIESLISDYRHTIEFDSRRDPARRRAGQLALDIFRHTLAKVFAEANLDPASHDRLIIAPDGALFLFPFEASVVAEGGFEPGNRTPLRYFVTEYPNLAVSYVNGARDVRDWGDEEARALDMTESLLVGIPIFDFDTAAMQEASTAIQTRGIPAKAADTVAPDTVRTALSSVLNDEGNWQRPWAYLTDSVEPFRDIEGVMPGHTVYDGIHAMEEVVQSASSPSLLTLVTHGVFIALEDDAELYGAGRYAVGTGTGQREVHDPMLRSMLLFAGANQPATMDEIGLHDGLLTAAEVARLDLSGTRLVALIGCQTAEGVYETWVGVSGLRRAFDQTGAEAIMGSMWTIPARTSPELYEKFRRNWLEEGLGKSEALHRARLDILRAQEHNSPMGNPFYWAGLVLIGDPN